MLGLLAFAGTVSQAAAAESSEQEELSENQIPYIFGANIAEYDGVIYISREFDEYSEPDASEAAKLQKLDVGETEYPIIGNFAFYEDKIYYICRSGGTSDFESALYCCDLDGSNQVELAGDITDPLELGNFPAMYNQEYKVQITENKELVIETYLVEDGVVVTDNYQIAVGYAQRLAGITEDSVYYEVQEGGDSVLYRYDLASGESAYVDRHMAVGGGIYFNY